MEDDETTRRLNAKNADMLAAIRRRNQARGAGSTPETSTPSPSTDHTGSTPSCDTGSSSASCD